MRHLLMRTRARLARSPRAARRCAALGTAAALAALLGMVGALPALATGSLLAGGVCAIAAGVVVERRHRRAADSWEAFERGFWEHVARRPRSDGRSRRSP